MATKDELIHELVVSKARSLDDEQLAYLTSCVDWYNARIWNDPRQVDHNPSVILEVAGQYAVQCEKSKHTFTPGEWAHFFYDMYRRALGDSEATARVAARRDIMNSLQS